MTTPSTTQASPDLRSAVQSLPYPAQVKHWGSHQPWGKRGSERGHIPLRHKTAFPPAAVTMNERGDILDMPPIDKPCLGRAETLFRHGRLNHTRRDPYRGEVKTAEHRCGRCPVRDACAAIVERRLNAHPRALTAFKAWRREAIRHHGRARFEDCFGRNHTIYTGQGGSQCGYLWQAFLGALADVGPFESCNDRRLEELAEAAAQKTRERRRRNKQKWREHQRAMKRAPDAQFIADAMEALNLREGLIQAAVHRPDLPLSVRKLDARGCSITVNVWFEKTLLEAAGEKPTAGKIARRLIEQELVEGISEEALRQRIHNHDFRRIEELERDRPGGPIWPPFDPLKSAEDDERFDHD